jgi:quinol monooxygenase YgiN
MAIFRIARYTIQSEALDACADFIHTTVACTQEREPGTLMYMVLQETDNPTSFVHISAYADEDALARHVVSEPMLTTIREVIQPAMISDAQFTHYSLVDAKLLTATPPA